MKVSLIIPTYNRASLLKKTLFAIQNQTISKDDFEVLVCDDGSTDNTQDICQSFSKKMNIRYFFQEDMGFRAGEARNMGIRFARNDLCVFIDSGIILSTYAIQAHVDKHKNSKKEIAVIGYNYGFSNESVHDKSLLKKIDFDNIDDGIKIANKNKLFDSREEWYKKFGENLDEWEAPWAVCWSGNLSVLKKTIDRLGMFDPFFNSWGAEDNDFGILLTTNGISIKLCRVACGIEYPTEKQNEFLTNPKKAVESFKNKKIYLDRKYSIVATKVWLETTLDKLNEELIQRKREMVRLDLIYNETEELLVKENRSQGERVTNEFFLSKLVPGKCTVKFFVNTGNYGEELKKELFSLINEIGIDSIEIIV